MFKCGQLATLAFFLMFVSLSVKGMEKPVVGVSVSGAVHPVSGFRFIGKARISDLLKQVQYQENSCPGAAALLRLSHREEQARWKQSVLYDLQALAYKASLKGSADFLNWLGGVERAVRSQSVTGRMPGIYINPHGSEARPEDNLLLEEGDRLHLPVCSGRIYLVDGFFTSVRFDSTQTLNRHAEQLPTEIWHQPGYLWVVHPDGAFKRVKAGYWQHQSLFVGDGGYLFRPIDEELLQGINPNFNFELARWLSTQVVSDR